MNKWLKLSMQILLALAIVILGYIIYRQIMTPMQFKREAKIRETAVIERIKDIRSAEQAFKQINQRYTGDFDSLIHFVLTDSLVFERQIGSKDDSIAVAKGLVKSEKFTKAVIDTVFAPKKLTPDQVREIRLIPYAQNGKEFILKAGQLVTESKVVVPVFEAKAPYKEFLWDLDEQLIINMIEDAKKVYYKYPGIAVGSVDKATNDAGNWE